MFVSPFVNSKFFRKPVYEKFGFYNTSYSISADREFLLRLAIKGVNALQLAEVVYCYRKHPGSLTFDDSSADNVARRLEEKLLISEEYLRKFRSMSEIRHLCRKWHTVTSLKQFVMLGSQKKYWDLVTCTLRGIKYDLAWPGLLVGVLLRSIFMKIARKRDKRCGKVLGLSR